MVPTTTIPAAADACREITFTVEAGHLVPGEFEFSVFASGLQDIAGDLEEIFELRDVCFMVWVEDFEEWCVPADMDDIGDVARLRITAGTPAVPTEALPASVPAQASAEAGAEMERLELAATDTAARGHTEGDQRASSQGAAEQKAAAAEEAARVAAVEVAERERAAAEKA